ncbi:MAG: suppressor of fused domain protein [Cyanobacteria bacterium P01_G01_bin.54]
MSKPSSENKSIAKKIISIIGGSPTVTQFWDENEDNHIDLLSLENSQTHNATTFCSLGLSDSPLYFRGKEYSVRVELMGCCRSKDELFANIISTAAFYIMKDHWFCAPGVIYPDIVTMYYPETSMKHLFFMSPFFWNEALPDVMEFSTKKVAFLLGVPISEQERNYAVQNSPRELEDLFEKEQINILDLDRDSVL